MSHKLPTPSASSCSFNAAAQVVSLHLTHSHTHTHTVGEWEHDTAPLTQQGSGFSAGSVQRDLWSPDPSPGSRRSGGGGAGARSLPLGEAARVSLPWATDRVLLRKTISVDDRLLQPVGGEQRHLRLLSRLERGRKKLRSIHVSLDFLLSDYVY